MKKIASIVVVLSFLLSAFVFCNNKKEANAEEPLPLSVYQNELDKINEQLGTTYSFPTEELLKIEGKTIDDVERYFQQMTLTEFRNFVYNIAQNDYISSEDAENTTIEHVYPANDYSQDTNINNRAYSSNQKFFYSGYTDRYLHITSTIFYADGYDRYSSVDYYGDTNNGNYPYYVVNSFSDSISIDRRTVTCNFACSRYVGPNLIDAATHNLGVIFTANGGDIYPAAMN